MTKSALPELLVLYLVLGGCCAGCRTQPTRRPNYPVAPMSADVAAEVTTEFQQSVAYWNAGNLDGFLEIYAESATFALPESLLVGRRAIREFYAPNFAPRASRLELSFEQIDVAVLAPDAVLVRGIYRNRDNGQVVRRGTTTLIMRRVGGPWRIIHDHSS